MSWARNVGRWQWILHWWPGRWHIGFGVWPKREYGKGWIVGQGGAVSEDNPPIFRWAQCGPVEVRVFDRKWTGGK